jgi:trehalose 6-phosphate phosphatase
MQPLFSCDALDRLAAGDVLLAFDFDGTLAPIVDHPAAAAMRSSTRHLLAQTAHLYPCAVISGRREEDVLTRLAGVTVWYVIGNRALQPPDRVEQLARHVQAWLPVLARRLQGVAGVVLENKEISLAVHYRAAQERDRAAEAIRNAAALLDRVRVVPGKDVINLIPESGDGKGAALEKLRKQLGCRESLYVGDDSSDEDAFRHSVGVRVGFSQPSSARYYIDDQDEIDELLQRLVDLRQPSLRRPEALPRATARRNPDSRS